MAKMTGQKVLVYILDKTEKKIAGQKDASLSLDMENYDITTKDSTWTESISGYRSWSVECQALVSPVSENTDEIFDFFLSRYLSGEPIQVTIKMDAKHEFSGMCVLTSLPVEFPTQDVVSYSISLTGTGPLTTIPVVEIP